MFKHFKRGIVCYDVKIEEISKFRFQILKSIKFYWNIAIPITFCVTYGCFCALRSELCNSTEVCRSENTYYLIFYRKSLLTPVVISTVSFDVWLAGSL